MIREVEDTHKDYLDMELLDFRKLPLQESAVAYK
jgi:hypothetical protein